jgi:hypothetical protein
MYHQHSLQTLENLHSRLLSLEMSLGARKSQHHSQVDFKTILNSLTVEINEIVTRSTSYKMHVTMIYKAISHARDTVSALNVYNDSDWRKVAGAIKTLHGTMNVLYVGTQILQSDELREICHAVISGTDIHEDNFIDIPSQNRNEAMLHILKEIGKRLGMHNRSYYQFLGDFGASKMMQIIGLLKQTP